MPLGGVQASSLLWRLRNGAWAQTVIAKLTFELRPGTAVLADAQEPVLSQDEHWDDDLARSIFAPSDLVPFKARADVVLVGDAFAPRGDPVRSLVARLQVGDINKAVEVVCDRAWTLDGQLLEGKRFTRMPLVFERAAGGPGTRNPVGVRHDAPADMYGRRPIPNLQPPDFTLHAPSDVVPSIGFGPISPSWPDRRERLGALADRWPGPAWHEQPLPEGLDPRFFNVAPSDQQVDTIRPDERILLENLHPEHARLVTSLPALRPRARVGRPGKNAEPLEMHGDTLCIDTNRGICTVTWRAQIQLATRDEPGLVTVDLPAPTAAPAQEGDEDAVRTIGPVVNQQRGPAMPFAPAAPGQALASLPAVAPQPPRPAAAQDEEAGGTFVLPPESVVELSEGDLRDATADQTLPPAHALRKAAALPFRPAAAPSPAQPPVPPPAVAPIPVEPPRVAPSPPRPPLMYAAPPPEPAIQQPASPWAQSGARVPTPTVGQSAAAPPPPVPAPAVRGLDQAGVLAASNAAAKLEPQQPQPAPAPQKTEPREEPRPQRPREILKLLWFEPKALPRIRRHEPWRVTLAELELRLLEEGVDQDEEDASGEGGASTKDRRDVFEILSRTRPAAAEALRLALEEAIDEEGRFEPPLVLVAGDLELPFDELETLKATATAAAPFAPMDKKLKEVLDTVAELLKTPWLQGSGTIAEGLTKRIQDAFAQSQRLGSDYLPSHTDRMLLEERRYQKRTVYGKTWIRGLLHLGGPPTPTYLPESLTKELPMFKRFRVRLIGEADLREDQYETHPHAIRALALARAVER